MTSRNRNIGYDAVNYTVCITAGGSALGINPGSAELGHLPKAEDADLLLGS